MPNSRAKGLKYFKAKRLRCVIEYKLIFRSAQSVFSRDGLNVKLMKFELQGPSPAQAPSNALGG